MDISDTKKLMKIDEIIKQKLEDENEVMKKVYEEIVLGLKQLREFISQLDINQGFDEANKMIASFIEDLSPLLELGSRFENLSEHAKFLGDKLNEFSKSLTVYGTAEKATMDFNNNIVYQFKVVLLRDLSHDIEFNKKIEEMLS